MSTEMRRFQRKATKKQLAEGAGTEIVKQPNTEKDLAGRRRVVNVNRDEKVSKESNQKATGTEICKQPNSEKVLAVRRPSVHVSVQPDVCTHSITDSTENQKSLNGAENHKNTATRKSSIVDDDIKSR